MSFTNWQKKLAGEKVTTFIEPTHDDEGYYRIPVTEAKLNAAGKTNGQRRIIGWRPVAYFLVQGMHGVALAGVVDDRDMTAEEIVDLWQWCCARPITEDLYRAVAERGEPWPDLHPPVDTTIGGLYAAASGHPQPAREQQQLETELGNMMGHNKPPQVAPDVEHREGIENAVRAAKDLQVTDEASAAVLLGAENRIAELRVAADKAGHAIYDPLHAVYKAEQQKWPGMIALARDTENMLHRRYLAWRADEKKKADEAAAAAAAEAKRIEEANARAADRAIARGEPEAAPEVPEASQEAPPAPAPVTPTYRAQGQRTKPKEVETWHLDGIDNWFDVFTHFKDNADVRAALLKVATAAVKNGQEVPGTRRHFGLI